MTDDTEPDEFADFDAASFKALCAHLGIETHTVTDPSGRVDVRLDRRGMQQLRDSAEAAGFPDLADIVQLMLDTGGKRIA